MKDMLLGISPDFLYLHQQKPKRVDDVHQPYFLSFTPENTSTESAQKILKERIAQNPDHPTFSKIVSVGDVETYRSFSNFTKKRKVFKVFTKESYVVPEVSDYLFFEHGLYTAEHDIPYQQRALTDLASDERYWIFDTDGEKRKLKVLIYDIETTSFEPGKNDVPIDIIGFSECDLHIESEKRLSEEEFRFDIIDCDSNWQDIEVKQLISRNVEEEIQNITTFCSFIPNYDIISGHNILGFDNLQVHGRIRALLKNHQDILSSEERKTLQCFVSDYCRVDKSFHFGVGSEVLQFYPTSFDTYLAARKFYSFLDDFSLKALAPFLGIMIKDRIVLTPAEIKIDARTLKYNKQDVQEQMGVTLNLIQQALPLAFTTCMPFDMLLPAGAVNMWDHMALIRAGAQKKIMPPIHRVKTIAQVLVKEFNRCSTKEEIVRSSKKKREQLSKDYVRVIKYGDEMPDWVTYPYVIFNSQAKDADDILNYHMPGGMTIKPDKDANSDFIPWYHVVVADVGAMYPTILKAMNVGGDTVRLATSSETPDAYVWLKKLPKTFFERQNVHWRSITKQDTYADKGYILGVMIDHSPGVVNRSMTGIMNVIAKLKEELKEAKQRGSSADIKRLAIMYQSMKGARNAGTHGILAAPSVSGRQFNLWGAATITTKGQMILADTLQDLEKKGIRVVYGDTDGIYLGCSQSTGNLPSFSKALGISVESYEDKWLTKPSVAFDAIEQSNNKWRQELQYPEFELEPETHDAMIFVKHKNYLIFDEKNGIVKMTTKGNNFKGSDKANIARKILNEIMIEVLKENPEWDNEEEARKNIKNAIKSKTRELLAKLDLTSVDLDDLTLIQSVQPAKRYKPNQDGSVSTFGKRVQALEQLLDRPIKSRMKFKFVVTKRPLPGIPKPSKSGVKPIDFMYPVDLLKHRSDIDLEWYKKMIENYVSGAFGLSDIQTTEQTGLDAWM